MKLSIISAGLLAAFAFAAPTPKSGELIKHASPTDACDIGYATTNGGTTGGAGGTTVTVSTYADLQKAAALGNHIVIVSGPITHSAAQIEVASHTTIIGANSQVVLEGLVRGRTNVIIRNLAIKLVVAAHGDAIGIQKSTNVWVDHVDLSSELSKGKDFYDGLFDVTHAADFITISNSYIHDHWKASLIGHSDNNGAEDAGHLHVTYANNHWQNINSRGPSIRYGTAHIFNNYHVNVAYGINTRDGAQALVESNVWTTCKKALYSTNRGFAVAHDDDFGDSKNEALEGDINPAKMGYNYTLLGADKVKDSVVGVAGVTLSF
ncbi:hypothetical protein NHQ30_004983 [Ciborinia camelliae]|nr:hypothetical protein NHQ30_004983 [Ciborinia camelliae]